MIYVLHQLASLAMAAVMVWWLRSGSWTHACPRAALLLWQVVGLTAVASVIGTLLGTGLAPYHRGLVPALGQLAGDLRAGTVWHELGILRLAAVGAGLGMACWLVASQLVCLLRTARSRARHRRLLTLVAREEADSLVLDHPAAVAYCLPGRVPRIVVSAGARALLTPVQLRAVLAHERAHASERHHLVLAPFQALARMAPRSGAVAAVCASIQLLVEMRADDRAGRGHGREPLAAALERFHAGGAATTPAGALAVTEAGSGPMPDAVRARVLRLRHPRRPVVTARLLAAAMALTALVTSLSLFALPV